MKRRKWTISQLEAYTKKYGPVKGPKMFQEQKRCAGAASRLKQHKNR